MGTKVADVAGKAAHVFEFLGIGAVDEAFGHGERAHHVPTYMILEDIGDRGDGYWVNTRTVDLACSR